MSLARANRKNVFFASAPSRPKKRLGEKICNGERQLEFPFKSSHRYRHRLSFRGEKIRTFFRSFVRPKTRLDVVDSSTRRALEIGEKGRRKRETRQLQKEMNPEF